MTTSPPITLCPDIIPHVLECLAPGRMPLEEDFPAVLAERKIRRHTLAMSARLCHAFAGPALDLLWRVLDDVKPLLSIIPSFMKEYGLFAEAVTDAEWERFQGYAGRVRELNALHNVDRHSEEPHLTWMVLMQRSRGLPLLPRLERLVISHHRSPLLMMLGSTLTHLDINLSNDSFLSQTKENLTAGMVRPYLPNLKGLSCYHDHVAPEDRDQAPGKIEVFALTNLHEVEIRHMRFLTRSMLTSLMAFLHLRKLDLEFERFAPEDRVAVAETPLEPGFFDLKELHLRSSFDAISTFFNATNPPCLESLSLTHESRFDPVLAPRRIIQDLHTTYTKIPRGIRCFHLRIVNHSYYYDDRDVAEPPQFPVSDLLPGILLTLHRDMREVTLLINLQTQLTNADLLALCAAWPALTRFEFSFLGEDHRPNIRYRASLPTFMTLVEFVRTHPHLERLALPCLSVERIPDITEMSPNSLDIPRHGLRLLRLSSLAPGTHIVLLALALDRMFPELELGYARVARAVQSSENIYDTGVLMILLLTLQTARRPRVRNSGVEHEE
ncbi:hypothetical protein C8Q78DRAFT_977101 [Trametes maxima]|nr:hypothetical protein C8Q78DRAFT_977101 [Trametes maxima]